MKQRLLFVGALLVLCGIDLVTKSLAFSRVPEFTSPPIVVIDGFFYITHAENDGAMWSLFQGLPAVFWVVVRGGVFGLMLWHVLRQNVYPAWVRIAFLFVLSGALGNLVDNMTGNGRVRDFVTWVFWGWQFPTFNVADSLISVGAVMLALWFLVLEPRKARKAHKAAAA
ncbi:MAG: signal peptidase II [Planctomycetes bacterium]|nr:signal peptidase II [Planctomycetota bacterium]